MAEGAKQIGFDVSVSLTCLFGTIVFIISVFVNWNVNSSISLFRAVSKGTDELANEIITVPNVLIVRLERGTVIIGQYTHLVTSEPLNQT